MSGLPYLSRWPQHAPSALLGQPFNSPQTPPMVPQTCPRQMNSGMDIEKVDIEPSSLHLQAEGAGSEYKENDDTANPTAPDAKIDSTLTSTFAPSNFAESRLPAKRRAEDPAEPSGEENVMSKGHRTSTGGPTKPRGLLSQWGPHTSVSNSRAGYDDGSDTVVKFGIRSGAGR
ncbi:MAG: hypothetical protein Q9175_007638 [Cornicularia normoerica]